MSRRIDVVAAARRGKRRPSFVGFAVLLGPPLLLLAGRLLAVGAEDPFAASGGSGRFLAFELVSFAASVLFLPAALLLAWFLHSARSRAAPVGATLVALGVVGSVGIYALDFASVELAQAGPPHEMRSLFIAMLESPGVQLLRLLELGLPIGLVLLAWALRRQGGVRWQVSLGIAVGVVLSNDNLPDAAAVVGAMLLLAGFGAAGTQVLGQAATDRAT